MCCQSKQQCHFDVQNVLHEQVILAVVNHIYVFHKVMNGWKTLKDSLKVCFENVNIESYVKVLNFKDSGILTVSQVKVLKFKNPEVLMGESSKFL